MIKIQGEYFLREAADSYFLLPAGQTLADDSRMLRLNEAGAFLWKHLEGSPSRETLLEDFQKEYPDVLPSQLEQDLNLFLEDLHRRNMVKENDF